MNASGVLRIVSGVRRNVMEISSEGNAMHRQLNRRDIIRSAGSAGAAVAGFVLGIQCGQAATWLRNRKNRTDRGDLAWGA